MGLKRKVDLTPLYDSPPLKRIKGEKKSYYSKKERKPFRVYRTIVWKLTELNAHSIIDINKRSFKEYHIDHKISIYYGFKNNIVPWCIADVSNLRMLDDKSNMIKGTNIYVDELNEWIIE